MIEVAFDQAITELAPVVGVKNACAAVGRPRANHYRRHAQSPAPTQPKREPRPQPRALSAAERAEVLAVLHEAGPAKWTYFDLYSIIDIYSRYTAGWMVATRESKELAERLLGDTIAKQNIDLLEAALQQRQPVLRGPVPDPEIPPRLPRHDRISPGRTNVLRDLLPLVTICR